jgi:outer membrane protein OmpA-like peptidoglycan-associated protein
MRIKWISVIAVVMIASACSTVTKQLPRPETGQKVNIDIPRPAPLPTPVPTVQPPPDDPKPVQPTQIADELEEDSIRLTEEKNGEPAAITAAPDGSVFFPARRTQVDALGKALLRRHAEQLKNNPDLVITLVGHVDSLGSRSYGLALAEERLDSVYQILRSLGVPRGQIRRINSGRGTVDLRCNTASCRQLARRVELMLTQ